MIFNGVVSALLLSTYPVDVLPNRCTILGICNVEKYNWPRILNDKFKSGWLFIRSEFYVNPGYRGALFTKRQNLQLTVSNLGIKCIS